MDARFGLEVIDKSPFATLSVVDKNGDPYSLPLSVVRKNNVLYFHSAKAGKKVDLFSNKPRVSLTFVCDVCVPDFLSYEELNKLQEQGNGSEIASRVFTTEYASAIVIGTVSLIDADSEKREALRMICEKYTPDKMFLFDAAIKSGMKLTNVYSIAIETITAKRKKFDADGNEMKWGRAE